MQRFLFFIGISFLTVVHGSYNPIPIGAVIVSTTSKILVIKPVEYGGTDESDTIFTAPSNMTIISSVYDSTPRNLYILYTTGTNSTVYLCQLVAVELLSSTIYQLPISFNTSDINRMTSFTSDITNKRIFLTDQTGTVQLLSMSGLLETTLGLSSVITYPIRSVAYSNIINRLIAVTDSTVDSCVIISADNFQCCEAAPRLTTIRSIAFNQVVNDLYIYVLDEFTGIYQVVLNSTGCPTAIRPINTLGSYQNLQFVIDRGLYFASASSQGGTDNSLLVIANGTATPRAISIGATIVALALSYPNTQVQDDTDETCFHGITYNTYRAAVVLAAIFGTIMGIFMCVNTLFCIDFFMTKRIIRNLKQQIPHNLLEDRWNKLVEEKYAKIALEKQRKKDDPPPRRGSSLTGRKSQPTTTAGDTNVNQASGSTGATISDSLQVPNPIPKISAYIRRKSESYIGRRRSDDYRTQRQQLRNEGGEGMPPSLQGQSVAEEHEHQRGLRPNESRKELLRNDIDFL